MNRHCMFVNKDPADEADDQDSVFIRLIFISREDASKNDTLIHAMFVEVDKVSPVLVSLACNNAFCNPKYE